MAIANCCGMFGMVIGGRWGGSGVFGCDVRNAAKLVFVGVTPPFCNPFIGNANGVAATLFGAGRSGVAAMKCEVDVPDGGMVEYGGAAAWTPEPPLASSDNLIRFTKSCPSSSYRPT